MSVQLSYTQSCFSMPAYFWAVAVMQHEQSKTPDGGDLGRDPTHALAVNVHMLNHWTSRKALLCFLCFNDYF